MFLLAGLITAALLPLAQYTKVIWVDPKPTQPLTPGQIAMLSAAMQKAAIQQPEFEINWLYVILGVYMLGLAFFGIRLLADIFKIRKMLSGKSILKQKPYRLVDSPEIEAPFSFFNYIVYNSDTLQPHELESILTHEKVHSRQKHSLDMLLAQAFCILFWFNPIAWLYKKTISQNLEFIADAEATKLVTDIKAYQKTMLRLSVQPQHISITNHFYQSLIKKRIVMLNKQKSRRRNSWKYAVVLPALAAFIMAFQVKVVAQEKEPAIQKDKSAKISMVLEVTKDSKDEELQEQKDLFKAQFDADILIGNVARNEKKEITGIRAEIKAKGQSKVYEVTGTEPIATFTIEAEKDDQGNVTINYGNAGIKKPLRQHYVNATATISADTVYSSRTSSTTYTDSPKNGGASRTVTDPTELDMGKDVLVVLNGKKMKKGEPVKLPEGEVIEQLTVRKDKEARKQYGRDARKGVIEITTHRKVAARGFVGPQAFVFTEPDVIISPAIRQRIVIGSYNNDDVNVYEELSDNDYLIIKDSDEAYNDLTLEEFKKQFAENKSAGVFTTTTASGYDDRVQQIKDKAFAAQIKDKSYKMRFYSEQMKQEMEETRAEMEKTRREMEETRKQMEKERAKYQAKKQKSQKA